MTTRVARLNLVGVMYRRAKRAAQAAEPDYSSSGYDNSQAAYLEGMADAFLWLADGTETPAIADLLKPPVAGATS